MPVCKSNASVVRRNHCKGCSDGPSSVDAVLSYLSKTVKRNLVTSARMMLTYVFVCILLSVNSGSQRV